MLRIKVAFPFLVSVIVLLSACNLQSGKSTPIPTPDIPDVQFQFPQNNSTVFEGVDLNIELLASDTGSGVARVDLLIDDQLYQQSKPQISEAVPTFTVTMNWLTSGIGQHSLTAVAYRQDGTASAPQTIIIEVLTSQ